MSPRVMADVLGRSSPELVAMVLYMTGKVSGGR